jgi:hypothetical protein
MNGLFEGISQFFQDNSILVSVTTVVTAVGGGLIYYITKKVIPATIDTLLTFVNKIVTKMFGGTVEGVSDEVKELPIMAKMNDWQKELRIQNEMKVIELKNKLASPKLSKVERIAYQSLYDKIILDLGDNISLATLETIKAIDEASKA